MERLVLVHGSVVGARMTCTFQQPLAERFTGARAGARAIQVERAPREAEIPLDVLAAAPFPKLVFSGNHSAAFDGICDVLEERLPGERVVLAGFGHTVQRHPDLNDRLADFVTRARVQAT